MRLSNILISFNSLPRIYFLPNWFLFPVCLSQCHESDSHLTVFFCHWLSIHRIDKAFLPFFHLITTLFKRIWNNLSQRVFTFDKTELTLKGCQGLFILERVLREIYFWIMNLSISSWTLTIWPLKRKII